MYPQLLPPTGILASSAVFDGRMWVLEGYSQATGNRNDVWYSP